MLGIWARWKDENVTVKKRRKCSWVFPEEEPNGKLRKNFFHGYLFEHFSQMTEINEQYYDTCRPANNLGTQTIRERESA